MSRFMPAYRYTNSHDQSRGCSGGDYDNDGSIRTAEATTTTTATTSSNDKNGIRFVQPLSGFRLNYFNETWTFTKNFRSDGYMRCDIRDRVRDSVYVGGYFKVKGLDREEVSAKLNGGPHTSSSLENTYADTMDVSIINFLGTRSRVRWEKTHPNYSNGISASSSYLPIGDVRNKWRGYCGLKINLDDNDDDRPDRVA